MGQKNIKISVFAEIFSVFAIFLLWIKYLETTWVGPFQLSLVGWDFFAHLMMFVFPLLTIVIFKRPFASLGLTAQNWRDPEMRKVVRIAVAELAVIWFALFLLPHLLSGEHPHLLLPPSYFAESYNWPLNLHKYLGWGITVIFTTVFCGLGEEFFFRGYMQGRFNAVFGKPLKFLGVNFGCGLIAVSIIFGMGHGLANFNPFSEGATQFKIAWGEAAVTAFEGFIFGLVYEKTGGIIAPAILHAFIGLFFGALLFL